VEQMYSDIWLPDLLDSLKCDSSLFSIRLNWNEFGLVSVVGRLNEGQAKGRKWNEWDVKFNQNR
jgi:hypothetical protein